MVLLCFVGWAASMQVSPCLLLLRPMQRGFLNSKKAKDQPLYDNGTSTAVIRNPPIAGSQPFKSGDSHCCCFPYGSTPSVTLNR